MVFTILTSTFFRIIDAVTGSEQRCDQGSSFIQGNFLLYQQQLAPSADSTHRIHE